MPTQEEEESLEGAATSTGRTASAGSAADTTGAMDKNSSVHRRDTLGTGQEIRIAVSTPLADTTGGHTRSTTTRKRRRTGGSSTTAATVLMRTVESEKATAAEPARPMDIRRHPIAHRTQVSSAANLMDSLPGASPAALSLTKTLRAPKEKHRTQAIPISLAGDTSRSALAVTVQAASTWEAGMDRGASKPAGRISAGGTRTAEEGTPAVTAAASMVAETIDEVTPGRTPDNGWPEILACSVPRMMDEPTRHVSATGLPST